DSAGELCEGSPDHARQVLKPVEEVQEAKVDALEHALQRNHGNPNDGELRQLLEETAHGRPGLSEDPYDALYHGDHRGDHLAQHHESPRDHGGRQGERTHGPDQVLHTLVLTLEPVAEALRQSRDHGDRLKSQTDDPAQALQNLTDELLEPLIAQQVTERLRGVLELRTNVLAHVQQSRPRVLQERLKARMNPGTEVLEQKEHLVERGSPALGGSANDAGHRPELLDQDPEPRSDVLNEGAHVLEERGHVRLELAAGEGGQDRLKGAL